MPIHFDHPHLGSGISPLQQRALKEAFLNLYTFVGAKKSDHFILTSSGAEGVNHAVFAAYLDITRKTGKNHFLCCNIDEAPAIMAMSRLKEAGCLFQMIPSDCDGRVTKKSVAEMLTPRTAMLSMSWACGLTGVMQPVLDISELCRDRGILFHVEATHVLGKGDFSFKDSGADILTFQGVPQGTGGLFFRENMKLSPLILGGSEQGGMRGGPLSFSTLVACAAWAKEEKGYADHYGIEIVRLKTLFEEEIMARIPSAKIPFRHMQRAPHITSFLFPGAASDSLCYLLSQKGIQATYGGGVFQHFSHVLKACGITEPDCHCGLSFGFTPQMTEEDVLTAAAKVVESVLQLQHSSRGIFHEL